MQVWRLWSLLAGYVIIRVKGSSLERLVNLAASRGVRLSGIQRVAPDVLYAQTSIGGFRALRPLARRLGCELRIRRRGGLPFVAESLGRRKALTAGVFLFLAVLYLLSSFVWFIRLTGVAADRRAEMLVYLRERGLRVGAPLNALDRDGLAKGLLRRYPDLTWASVEVRGTLVNVKVVRKTLVSPEETAPRHLVAARDGLVTDCLPLRGEPLVQPGDTVVRGQILISGIVPQDPQDAGQADGVLARPGGFVGVRAEGSVRARVWYEAEGTALLSGVREVPTGRKKTVHGLQIGSWRVWLGPRSAPFADFRQELRRRPLFETGTAGGLTVEWLQVTMAEVRRVRYQRGATAAERLAGIQAEERLRRETGSLRPRTVTREVERTGQAVKVRLLWELEQEIQVGRPLGEGEPPPAGLVRPDEADRGSEKRD